MSATVTVIDTKRGITPRAFDRAGTGAADPLFAAKLVQLQEAAKGRDAHGILELALTGEFKGKPAVVSSFGSESAVLLHLVSEIDPNTPFPVMTFGPRQQTSASWFGAVGRPAASWMHTSTPGMGRPDEPGTAASPSP